MKRVISCFFHACSTVILLAALTGCKKDDPGIPSIVSDVDGNKYNTVTIGEQVWLKENLMTTRLNDGTPINLVTGDSEWINASAPGYCWYNNDKPGYGDTYGALYNWHAVNSGKLCPKGWHVSALNDWTKLVFYLGSYLEAATKLKEAGTTHWTNPDSLENPPPPATNESGFTALPGGSRSGSRFSGIRDYGVWWTATPDSQTDSWALNMYWFSPETDKSSFNNTNGFSVRCMMD